MLALTAPVIRSENPFSLPPMLTEMKPLSVIRPRSVICPSISAAT